MNQQQQIDIIQAHMEGKKVMEMHLEETHARWVEITKGEYNFDFRNRHYKIEPRRVEAFMSLPSGLLQALGRMSEAEVTAVIVGNTPPAQLRPGYVTVRINYLEP
jgi:hypothetical protein